ncbi:methylmalonyl-CoA epimerase [Desulfarculus baarsii DSM 2075]|uniref:Methylmalonyl-CoA epimerase n=1 Tax=Desulfarculus baarsii (strain ATCC 33931 / DSM 2075 / LMG 7858 / VKM B-1802 / 2st14) TaxID=644282 RepID=E1QES6_DESB2|nr:methylmalonyl-CoA epimerase [Desulfarculus baarsii]ADK84062.1 methylmalonyl-CoA epimerase [Desulfarculus baarsii DSM 2075]
MKIKRLAHIGVAVGSVDEAAKVYTSMLPLELTSTEPVGELVTGFIPVGETNIELVQSTTDDGVIAKYVAKKGEGVHHLAFEVDDIVAAIAELKAKGVPLTSDEPRPGAHGAKVVFLHPKATHGVLIELCQYPQDH